MSVVSLAKNVGFPEANNQGLAAAGGDYIALVNPDATADERWLAELLDVVERDDRIAAVSPKIYRAGSPAILEQAGAEFSNLGHYWTRGFNQPERGQFDVTGEVPGLTGCSVLVRRSALHGEPLFDGSFFLYYEEFDLTLRLRGRGYAIAYAPRAIVHHKGMQTMSEPDAPAKSAAAVLLQSQPAQDPLQVLSPDDAAAKPPLDRPQRGVLGH